MSKEQTKTKNIQTVRLVPDITNMNFFKSMSFKSGEKQEIYTNNGKKTSRRLAETEPTARSRNRKARMKRPSGLFHVECCYVAIWVVFFLSRFKTRFDKNKIS